MFEQYLPLKQTKAGYTHFFHRSAMDTEADLRKHFLSEDLSAVCLVAAASKSVVLISTAAHPLKQRREALTLWRKEAIEETFNLPDNKCARAMLELLSQEDRESFYLVETSFEKCDQLLAAAFEVEQQKYEEKRREWFQGLTACIKDSLGDCEPNCQDELLQPFFHVISACGALRNFQREDHASKFAGIAGGRVYRMNQQGLIEPTVGFGKPSSAACEPPPAVVEPPADDDAAAIETPPQE